MTRGRWIGLAVLMLAAVYAWQGGIFSAADYRELQRQAVVSEARGKALEREVDSLKAFADSLERDPSVQERVAREQFGMVRPGEMSFTITKAEPAKRDSAK